MDFTVKRFLQILSALAILSLLLVGAPPPAAHASTIWTVESTEDGADNASNCPGVNCRLRDAIMASVSGDTINFSVTGTITLQGPLVIDSNLSISGPGAGLLTVDGNSLGRIFTASGSTVVSISGLTLTHGLVDDTTTADSLVGGAILVSPNSHLTLDQMVIEYNTVDCADPCSVGNGGAIASIAGSSLTITDSTISSNSATLAGGGIYFYSGTAAGDDLSLTNVTLMSNNVTDASVGNGGAIFIANAHQATLTNLTVSINKAARAGGGLLATGGPVSITDSTFYSNEARGTGSMSGGGAINVRGSTSLWLANSTINSNSTASEGGGVRVGSVVAVIYNSTFVSNSAAGTSGGGGIFEDTADLTLINNTMSGNMASSAHGGGLYLNGGTVSLRNMIVANSGGSDCRNLGATWVANVSNLIESNDVLQPCAAPAFSSDPNLGPLADNGGPTKTMRLPWGSPAIDHGDNSSCANAGTVDNKDQRGVPRPQGTHCDIGAYEYTHFFSDMPVAGKEWMEPWVDEFYLKGITTGCGVSPLTYCPENPVTRAAMAVFILRAIEGPTYTPPAAHHYFWDLPIAGKEWMEPWVDEFYDRGITTGCGTEPLRYCPENPVTRAAMAVFLLRALDGSSYVPDHTHGYFDDLPVTSKEWMEPFVDEFYDRGITTGCGAAPLTYCPENPVTRAAMSVFIGRAFCLYP